MYSYTSRLQEKTQVETQIAAMQAQIAQARNQQYKLAEELVRVRAPEYLDHVAREEFGLAKPGDKVITVIVADAAAGTPEQIAAEAAAVAEVEGTGLPVWQQWMTLLTAEGLRIDRPKSTD